MALKFAKKSLGAKVETTPGVDPTISADDSIYTFGFDITPIESNVVDLEQDRATLGAARQVSIGNAVSCSFSHYVIGRGTANAGAPHVKPAYDAVMQGVGMRGRSQEIKVWAVGDNYLVGDIKTDSGKTFRAIAPSTGATANNPSSGTNKADFWVEIEAHTAGTEFAIGDLTLHGGKVYRAHTAHTAGAGNTPGGVGSATYWHVYGDSYIYRPDSDDPKTVWLDSNLDGNQHVLKSARGNLAATFTAGALPTYQYNYQGFYVDPQRSKGLPYSYANYPDPQGVTNRDTPNAVLHGQRVVMNSLSFDLGNVIERIDEPGSEAIELNNRSISGNVVIEMTKVDDFNWFERIKDLTTGGLFLQHGKAGNRSEIFAPNCTLAPPSIENNASRYMLNIPIRFIPRDGDDDIEIRTL